MIHATIARAIELRENQKSKDALEILIAQLSDHANNPDLNYHIGWTYDVLGQESAAVRYYEKALKLGLSEGRLGAMVGLGSTYRCLGLYEKSLQLLDQAIQEFPEERVLKVFRALTYFNLGRSEDAVSSLLLELLDTSTEPSIKSYEKALRFYSDKLTKTWR